MKQAVITTFALVILTTTSFASDTRKVCSHPLGLTDRRIEDWQLAASSVKASTDDKHCAVKFARLHQEGARSWCARDTNDVTKEWLLVDLGVTSKVTGIVLQGRGEVEQWVTNFMISYSQDAYKWDYARDIYGNKKVFRGNSDAYSLKHSYLEHPIEARFIRIHVVGFHGHPAMRLEIMGCQECNEILSVEPFTELTASSYKRFRRRRRRRHSKDPGHTCKPEMANINSAKGWCPRKQNDHQWLQFDLGPPTQVTGLITKGQGDKKRYVTSYTVSYSNDSLVWFFYKEANHLEPKIFGGNMDTTTERRHYLNKPIVARYVRIHPTTWHKRIGLRAAIIGCPTRAECGPGFMQVNEASACIPNKAYGQETWVNDKRQDWTNWSFGHSSLAVDGNLDDNLHNCAIMDNYYAKNPVLKIDLGRHVKVTGVVVFTWQGKGQDKITDYTDYVHNLDKLTVYLSTRDVSMDKLDHNAKCASISRRNNALFNPRVHFECPEAREARFVYVKATGNEERWKKFFTVVLCEVMVY